MTVGWAPDRRSSTTMTVGAPEVSGWPKMTSKSRSLRSPAAFWDSLHNRLIYKRRHRRLRICDHLDIGMLADERHRAVHGWLTEDEFS